MTAACGRADYKNRNLESAANFGTNLQIIACGETGWSYPEFEREPLGPSTGHLPGQSRARRWLAPWVALCRACRPLLAARHDAVRLRGSSVRLDAVPSSAGTRADPVLTRPEFSARNLRLEIGFYCLISMWCRKQDSNL